MTNEVSSEPSTSTSTPMQSAVSKERQPILVICLEGCHGSGKTQLTHSFEKAGHLVLDEGFLDMPNTVLHPQSLLMESTWVCSWFRRLVDVATSAESNKQKALIADRSPLSAVFYALRNGTVLEPLIRACIEEVREVFNIHIVSVHIRTERELLWDRIQERLKREPRRAAFREDSKQWMDDVLAFYDSMQWDFTVSNNEVEIESLRRELLNSIADSFRASPFEDLIRHVDVVEKPILSTPHVFPNDGLASPSKLDALLGESPMKKRMRTPGPSPLRTAHGPSENAKKLKLDGQSPCVDLSLSSSFVVETPEVAIYSKPAGINSVGPQVVTPTVL